MVRRPATPERESWLFHHREGTARDEGDRLIANPYGFAEWFNENTPLDYTFVQQYEARSLDYERMMILAGSTEDDSVPPQESPGRKSKAAITLQLMKRWRNVQYDRRPGRRPPSILMSKLIAENAGYTETLSQELLYQTGQMLAAFEGYQASGMLIHAANPVCPEDILTDRWPGSMQEQMQFIKDLRELVKDVERLVDDCPLDDMREILTKLFGEEPTGAAINEYAKRMGGVIRSGKSRYRPGSGRIVVPTAVGTGVVTRPTPVRATPKHTFHGGSWQG